MQDKEKLHSELQRIDTRGYKAYKDTEGKYDFGPYGVSIDHVQGDPYASPSEVRVRVPMGNAGFDDSLYSNEGRKRAFCDYLARAMDRAIGKHVKGHRGTGKSGLMAIDAGGQEVLQRTAIEVTSDYVEARIVMGLPAKGRTVMGLQAQDMFFDELAKVTRASLAYKSLPADDLQRHVNTVEDQVAIRRQLSARNLVAFVGQDAVLPRESGVSDRPMRGDELVPFEVPAEMAVEIETPHRGMVRGMGICEGVTIIVGGGYHGKSTLLDAIMRGVYDHVPGDGRELVATVPDAVKIRAEDGRRVAGVDISAFIRDLPKDIDTANFATEDASGSTSQAANIAEAFEVGTGLLLVDEDTSATNFMIRDARMQKLVPEADEPITPFIDRIRQVYEQFGISTICVMGGSGDYFDVADTVILMEEYRPRCVTEQAGEIASELPTERSYERAAPLETPMRRSPNAGSVDPSKGKRRVRIRTRGVDHIQFGTNDIDLGQVEQIVDDSQTRAIGDAINYAKEKLIDGDMTVREIAETVLKDLREDGLTIIDPLRQRIGGEYALPRKHELAAAINRLPTLTVQQRND